LQGTIITVIGLPVRVYHKLQRVHRLDKPVLLVAAC